jgi:hypothetical protein
MGPRLKNCHVVRDIDQGGAPTSPIRGRAGQSWHTLWDLLPASVTPARGTRDTRTHHAAEGGSARSDDDAATTSITTERSISAPAVPPQAIQITTDAHLWLRCCGTERAAMWA